VRVAALKAITEILQNPLAHPALMNLIPGVGQLIHDKTEAVRNSMIDLLLGLSVIPNIKFYEIVPPPQLMLRLEADALRSQNSPSITGLVELLIPSYFPTRKGDMSISRQLHLSRCLSFTSEYTHSAFAFYRNAFEFVPLSVIVHLIVNLIHHAETLV